MRIWQILVLLLLVTTLVEARGRKKGGKKNGKKNGGKKYGGKKYGGKKYGGKKNGGKKSVGKARPAVQLKFDKLCTGRKELDFIPNAQDVCQYFRCEHDSNNNLVKAIVKSCAPGTFVKKNYRAGIQNPCVGNLQVDKSVTCGHPHGYSPSPKGGKKNVKNYGKKNGKKNVKNYGKKNGKNYGKKNVKNYGKKNGKKNVKNYGKKNGKNYGKKNGKNYGKKNGKNYGKENGKNYGKKNGKNYGKKNGKKYGKKNGKNYGKKSGKNYGKGNTGLVPAGDIFDEGCGVNLAIVMDMSCSVKMPNKKRMIEAVTALVNMIKIGKDDSLISIIRFDYKSRVVARFGSSQAEILKALEDMDMKADKCRTETFHALNRARKMLRKLKNGKPNVAYILTDGRTYKKGGKKLTLRAANANHKAGIFTLVAALPAGHRKTAKLNDEFRAIASKGANGKKLLFAVNSFDKLKKFMQEAVSDICNAPVIPDTLDPDVGAELDKNVDDLEVADENLAPVIQYGPPSKNKIITCKVDVMLTMDTSCSVRWNNKLKVLENFVKLTGMFKHGEDAVQQGCIQFDLGARPCGDEGFAQTNDTAEIMAQLARTNLKKEGCRTHTYAALEMAGVTLIEEGRPGVPKVHVVATDGQTFRQGEGPLTMSAAALNNRAGINTFVFALPAGDRKQPSNSREFAAMVSKPENLFSLSSYDDLEGALAVLGKNICGEKEGENTVTEQEWEDLEENIGVAVEDDEKNGPEEPIQFPEPEIFNEPLKPEDDIQIDPEAVDENEVTESNFDGEQGGGGRDRPLQTGNDVLPEPQVEVDPVPETITKKTGKKGKRPNVKGKGKKGKGKKGKGKKGKGKIPRECKDRDETLCKEKAVRGECKRYLRKACPVSCGVCEPSANERPKAVPEASYKQGSNPAEINLDGTKSTDDKEVVEYIWRVVSPKPNDIKIDTADAPEGTAVASNAEPGQEVTFKLIVKDGEGLRDAETVTVKIPEGPVAVAEAELDDTKETVELDGTNSFSPDNTPIADYLWAPVDGPADIEIDDETKPVTTFTAPVGGTYTVSLTVTDENGLTGSGNVVVEVPENEAPVANPEATVRPSSDPSLVDLDGSKSTDDKEVTQHQWTLVSPDDSNVEFSDDTSPMTEVSGVTPGVTYTFDLTVSDKEGLTNAETVTIMIPVAPVAAAEAELLDDPSTAKLDASDSESPAGSKPEYEWTVEAVPNGADGPTINDPSEPETTLEGLEPGSYTFKVDVTDPETGLSDSKSVVLDVPIVDMEQPQVDPIVDMEPEVGAPAPVDPVVDMEPEVGAPAPVDPVVDMEPEVGAPAPVDPVVDTEPEVDAPAPVDPVVDDGPVVGLPVPEEPVDERESDPRGPRGPRPGPSNDFVQPLPYPVDVNEPAPEETPFETDDTDYFNPPVIHPPKTPKSLGMASGVIPDGAIKSSSELPDNGPLMARPTSNSCWKPATDNDSEWIQVDVGTVMEIHGFGTMGGGNASPSDWTTSYYVEYSTDEINWTPVTMNNSNAPLLLKGNTDAYSWKQICLHKHLGHPITARYFRVKPKDSNGSPCLRVELYGFRDPADPALLEVLKDDMWTKTTTGCNCYFDTTDDSCACCEPGGAQCPKSNKHQCVKSGQNGDCGEVELPEEDAVNHWTKDIEVDTCPCDYDASKQCACCKDYGIQCGALKHDQCVAPGSILTDVCGKDPKFSDPTPEEKEEQEKTCTPVVCPAK
ncbi:unnamed protein product [Owenia fusiformis]|uniref:Uncharacterized protein n=1 Tax=Owenia fusiformis TaxID=6347 RepID=A0A8S4NLI2_OWEFU|nr:unnamed protein product [Owenia fusiformis]